MLWSATKEGMHDPLKNKSLELRQLFSKVANEALADGK